MGVLISIENRILPPGNDAMLKMNVKLFLKDRLLFCTAAAALAGCAVFLWVKAPSSNAFSYKTAALQNTLGAAFYVFLVLLFLSYKFLCKVHTHRLSEVQNTAPAAKKSKISAQVVPAGAAFLFTLLFTAYNLFFNIKFGLRGADYNLYVVLCCVLNIFLTGLLAVRIGAFLAKIKKAALCYALLVIFAFLFSPFFQSIAAEMKLYENVDITAVSNILNIFTPGLDLMANFNNGYSILPYRWALVLFWILLFCVLGAGKESRRSRTQAVHISARAAGAAVLLVVYLMPQSKILPDYSPQGSIEYDFYHYTDTSDLEGRENYVQKEEAADFDVAAVSLDIKISYKLKATAQIDLFTPSVSGTYKFTLYHGYRVSSVTDEHSAQLDFTQDNDYLTIRAGGVKSIVINYSGAAAKYYSNYQGVCLPGNFAYCPVPGYHVVYDSEAQQLSPIYFESDTDFRLNIDAPYKVYCNLSETGENEFAGSACGVTLLSGFLTQKQIDGITFIYSYLNDDIDRNLDKIADELKDIWETSSGGGYCILGKTVFILPNLQQGGDVTFLDDHIITRSSFSEEYQSLLEEAQ